MKSVLLIASAGALGLAALAALPHPQRPAPAPIVAATTQPDGLDGMRAKAAHDAELERMGATIERYQAQLRNEAQSR